MSRMPADRAQTALLRALTPVAGPFVPIAVRSVPWSSATFDGARHRLALRLEGAEAHARAVAIVDSLAETDLVIRGGFVADILATTRIEEGAAVLGIEALTIEEALPPRTIRCGGRRAG